MEISQAAITAIHGLAYLANADPQTPVHVKEIARELGVSSAYLAKIFQRLSHTHLVYSRRGPHGGYVSSLEPKQINLLVVIEAVDGPIATGWCELGPTNPCAMFDQCKIRKRLDKLRKDTRELYAKISLEMFAKQLFEGRCFAINSRQTGS
jgi:Rrf2 family protein